MTSATIAAPLVCLPTIENAWVHAAPPGTTILAGYARLSNPCDRAVDIVRVSSPDFAQVMIHEILMEAGVSKMRHVETLLLPVRGSVVFEAGNRHLMLMSPTHEIKAGSKVRLSFTLTHGRVVTADFMVRKNAL